MAELKKYYWLKLEKNFFKRHDIQIVEDMENGKDYVLFYIKLILESMNHEGRLRFNDLVPYNDKMLSTITNTNVDVVRSAIKIFQQLGMMEVWEDQTIYIQDTQKMLGFETEWAKKKRDYRSTKTQKPLLEDKERTLGGQPEDIVRQEIELELEIELDKEIYKDSVELHSPSYPYSDIIEYLNQKAETKYRASSKKTQGLIKARFKEGFELEDFKTVIDKKTNEWKSDNKMSVFLRPETLFGTKFESYLNQKGTKIEKDIGNDGSEFGLIL